MNSWRTLAGWPLIVGFLFLLGIWWLPGPDTSSTDSYSVTHVGKKAFYRVLRDMHGELTRTPERLADFEHPVGTYLILGPARYPTAKEWDSLTEQVARGMTLVFAARDEEPALKVPQLMFEVASFETPFPDAKGADNEQEDADDDDEGPNRLKNFRRRFDREKLSPAESSLLSNATWNGDAYLRINDQLWQTLLSVNGHPRVATRKHGFGSVVVCSSDNLFSNFAMLDKDRALLAYRVVEAGSIKTPIAFDESLNATGVPRVFGNLFAPELRAISLQLFLMLALFGWAESRRFGPPAPELDPPRRSIVEHALALGSLYYRAHAGAQVLRRWLEWFRLELHWQSKEALNTHDLEVLARWSRMPVDEVRDILKKAVAEAKNPEAKNSAVALLIQRLAQLRERIHYPNGR